jgi:hypothetical protein
MLMTILPFLWRSLLLLLLMMMLLTQKLPSVLILQMMAALPAYREMEEHFCSRQMRRN